MSDETKGDGPAPEAPVNPAEHGNYEGVSGGETTAPSGDPDAEASSGDAESAAGDD